MAYYSYSLIFLLLIFSVSGSSPTDQIAITSCLNNHNITNYTTFFNIKSHDGYYNLLKFSIQNLRFAEPTIPKPIAIILPESKDQLISTVSCCRKGPWEIRVRCGGHSYEGTSSSVANDEGTPFVIIDMMNLNRVSVDLETETAWVEGGATLGEIYYAIAESSSVHGFSAGSCPTVGAGGHIGGGGYGFLSRKYGLAADNVVNALLVNAEGELLDMEAMGEDVFWAIRGGGGGLWGVVYAWKIKVLKVPTTITNFVVSRPGTKSDVTKLINKWQHVAPHLEGDMYLSCFVGAGLPQTIGALSDDKSLSRIAISAKFNGFFLGPKTELVSTLRRVFPELGVSEDDCKETSWIESVLFFSDLGDEATVSDLKNRSYKYKHYFKAKSDYVRNPISASGILAALNILEKEPKGYVILDPYGGVMNNISSESIAFPHRKGNLYAIQYLVEWHETDKDKSDGYIEWIRGFYNAMAGHVSLGPRAAYINYMDFDLGVMELINTSSSVVPSEDAVVEVARAWGEKYFLNNYDRLVKAKTMIDPNNVFKNQQGIPPTTTIGLKASI